MGGSGSLRGAVTRSQILGAAVINLALHAAFLVAFGALLARLYALALAVVDGAPTNTTPSVSPVRRGIAVSACALLYSVLVAGGLVLLVFPGVYAAVRYAPWLHIAVNAEPRDISQSMRRAAALTKGHWLQVAGFVLVCLLINLGGSALLGIGLLVTVPVSLLASASLFRALERPTSGVA